MASMATAGRSVQGNFLQQMLKESVLDSIGWDITYREGYNKGFLGMRHSMKEIYGLGRSGATVPTMGNIYKMGRASGQTGTQAFGAAVKEGGGRAASFAGRTAMNIVGPTFLAYSMYSGYQQEGIFGAAKGAAEFVAFDVALRSTIAVLGAPLTVAAAAGTAIGYGAYAIGKAGKKYERKLRDLEMGGDENLINAINSYGASTMRQRAAIALNNSHINRRLALGNEASIFHSSYRR